MCTFTLRHPISCLFCVLSRKTVLENPVTLYPLSTLGRLCVGVCPEPGDSQGLVLQFWQCHVFLENTTRLSRSLLPTAGVSFRYRVGQLLVCGCNARASCPLEYHTPEPSKSPYTSLRKMMVLPVLWSCLLLPSLQIHLGASLIYTQIDLRPSPRTQKFCLWKYNTTKRGCIPWVRPWTDA